MSRGNMISGLTMTELRLLGPVEVVDDGRVDVGGARPARLLVALFVADRHRLDLDVLVDRCFGDDDRPDDPVPAIRTAVRRIRRALGDDTILTVPGGYELDLRGFDVDVDRFDELVAAGRATSDPVAAITSFRRALDLWRGRPFGGLGDLDWLAPERIRLEEVHLVALEGWHESHLRNGTATEIIPSLEAATSEFPLRERFHRQLMRALYVADRQADALRAFQTYRRAMAEAGLEPGPETVALDRRIASGDPALRPTAEGRPLRGYRIVERLGEGAFSIVYRGTQPSVDRAVAIKQIRAELANRPDFIRRFETEARMVAHLEHPFIVPLYDYWREPGSAYLVMRLLPGGSLESSLLDGPWSLERTSRMIEQVGAALSTAHRAGVVHRDVKPANILLDDEGNSYLTDFGIAVQDAGSVDAESSLSVGSPAYASPEQLRREPVGPSADVHGLAIAAYEALTARLPFPDEPTQAALLQRQLHDPIPSVRASRSDIPSAVDDVLQRATAKRAADRYQAVEEFVTAFMMAIDTSVMSSSPVGTATIVPAEERNPFKGLRAFDEADAADFAGRDRLVDQLVAELERSRFVAVVGPSGAGKSSVVRAGLLPSLRRGAVTGSERWYVSTLIPGAHPDEELESALLRVATEHPQGLLDVIRDGDRGISRALRRVLPEHGELLLVIDQFEELFTLCDDAAERRRFLDGLASAVTEERSRLRVVLTLRADFYDRPLRYESIGRLVRDATVPVLPLAADELERAIVDPARRVGAEFEPGLVPEIIADVADQPGALPLLQYALTELYEQRISNLLTRGAYRALGGVTGALSTRAEDLFAASTGDEQVQLRRLLTRLVTLGEGHEDTRRRVDLAEVEGLVSDDAVVERFGRARLLSFDRNPITREPTVEIAHEALLREWPRLRGWLDDDRDGLRIHRHLTETAVAWTESGRDDGELYRGGRLEAAAAWAGEHTGDLNDTEREFIAASVSLRDAEAAAEQEHARLQVRSNRRLRMAAAVATVVALIAAGAGVVAFRERDRAQDSAASAEAAQLDAEREAARAETQEQQAESEAERARAAQLESELQRLTRDALLLREQSPELAILLAAAAHRIDPGPLSLGALQQTMTRTDGLLGFLGSDTAYTKVLFPDDDTIVARSPFGLDIWDVPSRTLRHSLGTRVDGEMAPAGESQIVVAGKGALEKIDVTTGERVATRSLNAISVAVDESTGRVAAVPVGVPFVSIFDSDLETAGGFSLDFQPDTIAFVDGDLIVTKGFVVERVTQSGRVVWSTDGVDFEERFGVDPALLVDARFEGVEVSDDGSRVFADQPTWGVSVLDAGDGTLLDIIQTSTRTEGLSVSNGRILAGTHVVDQSDPSARWEIEPGARLAAASAMTPSGRTAVLAGDSGLSLWSLDGRQLLARSASASSPNIAAIDSTGSRLSWTDWPNGAWGLADLDTGSPIDADLDDAWQAGWLPSGDLMTFEITTRRTKIWNDDLAPDGVGVPPQQWSMFVPTPDGRLGLAGGIGANPGDIDVFDLATGERAATIPDVFGELEPDENPLAAWADFTSDGALMVVPAWQGPATLIDTETWTVLEVLRGPDDTTINSAAFSNDDSRLAIHTGDGWLHVVEIATGSTSTLGFAGEPAASPLMQAMAWGPDDDTIVLGLQDGVRIWDVSNGVAIGGAFPNESLNAATQSYDGRFGVTAIGDHVLVWDLDTAGWIDVACRAVGRDLTEEEWAQYGLPDTPHREACPR